jgi:ABC-2 type transport system ATP-binding protein
VIVATDDANAAACFGALPQVESVSSQGSQFTIHGRGDDLVTDVIHCLAEHRLRVTAFRTEVPTLEDVFLKLTGHLIRD